MKKEFNIDGKKVTVEIFDTVEKAIDYGWESLIYPDLTQVAEVRAEGFFGSLETAGEVKIITEDGDILGKSDQDEILEIIDAGKLERYYVDDMVSLNNWWAFKFGDEDSITDDLVFEAIPSTKEELIEELLGYYKSVVG